MDAAFAAQLSVFGTSDRDAADARLTSARGSPTLGSGTSETTGRHEGLAGRTKEVAVKNLSAPTFGRGASGLSG